VPFELLSREQLAPPNRRWPVRDKLVGGLRLPNDETGDCQLFTTRLAEMAAKLGVRSEFGVDITAPANRRRPDHRRAPARALFTADRYVVALGSYSRLLLKFWSACRCTR
jgi:D-amino-acid dehydrogenase